MHSLLNVERFCPDKIQTRLSFTSIHQPIDNCLNRKISYIYIYGLSEHEVHRKTAGKQRLFQVVVFHFPTFSTVAPSGNFPQLWNVYEKIPYSWMILRLYDLPYLAGGLEFGTWIVFFHILGIRWTTDFHIFQRGGNHQVAGASGAWRFYSVSASKHLFSTLLAVVGVVVFHQLCQLFQHDQWCTSLEITSPHILEVTTSQRWIHLWPHQSLHFSVKIGKNIQRTCSSVASRSCVNWSERAVA